MSIVEKLTEGIINRDLSREANALLDKWENTGLLEGIEGEHNRNSMACLLENQAKELLREASTMASGDVEGFAAVAFPIVRRVFGGLVANELVSVQPMSLPSGLIFFLDFTLSNDKLGYESCDSIYGGGVVGNQIRFGVDLGEAGQNQTEAAEDSFYNLNNGYGATTGSSAVVYTEVARRNDLGVWIAGDGGDRSADGDRLIRFDPDLGAAGVATSAPLSVGLIPIASLTQFDAQDDVTVCLLSGSVAECIAGLGNTNRIDGINKTGELQIRRLSRPDYADPKGAAAVNLLVVISGSNVAQARACGGDVCSASFVIADNWANGPTAIGSVVGQPVWDLEALGLPGNGGGDDCAPGNTGSAIAEIDIKVDSISITAMTKKLRAKWTPELQQDINAYHNLDAEVELTSILSEAIALEIDQEILEDLIKGATASTFHWSRQPGNFVDRITGAALGGPPPAFTGTVSEWYETLLEIVNDVSAQIHRKTLRGGANFIVTSPEVANLLEFTNGFRADTTADDNRGTAGAVKTGTISKKWDVYVDPYFPRNLLLVGRKGNGFLESGYVYAPYVPLQTTPTIFDPENFTPRKGVMTRYGKAMVRPDMYGLVVVENLFG
jgi:hypothetical protein